MNRYLCTLIALFLCIGSYAEKGNGCAKDTAKVQVREIRFNYMTKKFEDGIIDKLNINDWVQFVMTNIPGTKDSVVFQAEVEFANGHLEMGTQFGSFMNFNGGKENDGEVGTTESQAAAKAAAKAAIEKVDKETDSAREMINKLNLPESEVLRKTYLKGEDLRKDLNKMNNAKKLNTTTITKDLEIGVARNFIKQYIKSKHKEFAKLAEAAQEDVDWQKNLINLHQLNMQEGNRQKDSIIVSYAVKADTVREKGNGDYYFLPFKVQNFDNASINIKFLNKENLASQDLIIPFANKGGFKLDFSSGFVFNAIYDKEYVIVDAANGNVQIKDKNKELRFNTGLALMAHGYCRTGRFVNLGVTTGISYNLNVQNLNYLLGGSLLFGQDQRFIVTFGGMMGKSKILASHYTVDTDISQSQLTVQSAVPLVERLKISPFLGISYNLGLGTKTKKIKL
ncbi:hypothetical protein DBR32_13715 [Taibaiella sp. KBW10]|uniref:hypothetical protein n=1 Tax=Taibaiella sp. KBW10 TaxID=2153357 RepID=UPI000F592704|nr:hypothetical protein [Taibaiella sp. KBW10]RQO29967.1 hypothetical protein DBR32_13715 [Taibaiella sp. KBW10]